MDKDSLVLGDELGLDEGLLLSETDGDGLTDELGDKEIELDGLKDIELLGLSLELGLEEGLLLGEALGDELGNVTSHRSVLNI